MVCDFEYDCFEIGPLDLSIIGLVVLGLFEGCSIWGVPLGVTVGVSVGLTVGGRLDVFCMGVVGILVVGTVDLTVGCLFVYPRA